MQRNACARERGIHIGTSLAAAHSIASDLIHVQRNLEAEFERLDYLSQVLYGFSSHVSLDHTAGGYLDYPNNIHHSILLEVSASLTLFGGLSLLLQKIRAQLQALNHRALLQVAHTPLAALCAARWQHRDREAAGSIPLIVPANPHALGLMPLDCLALSERQGESLHNMGLRNCGALLTLPSKELGQRFGKALGGYLNRLTGTEPDPRQPIDPPKAFTSGIHMLDACASKTALLFPIKRLCHEFAHWLIAQQLGVCLLQWEFANHSGDKQILAVRSTRASQSGELLLKLTQLQLERCELPRDVLDIRLISQELEAWENHSNSLFPHLDTHSNNSSDAKNGNARPLTDLLDQLRARLGPQVCHGLQVHARHQPEQACQAEALTRLARHSVQHSTQRSGRKSPQPQVPTQRLAARSDLSGKHRPTWLLSTPQPVARRALKLLHGPERLQGGWWQERRLCRDYYIAQTRDQLAHKSYSWVFREGKRWFVHGYFG